MCCAKKFSKNLFLIYQEFLSHLNLLLENSGTIIEDISSGFNMSTRVVACVALGFSEQADASQDM